jgi:hypothetical protein
LVGIVAVLWGLWKMRNNARFGSVRTNDPVVVTNLIGQMISSWAILQVKEENRDALNLGVKFSCSCQVKLSRRLEAGDQSPRG